MDSARTNGLSLFQLNLKCLKHVVPYLTTSEMLKLILVDERFIDALQENLKTSLIDMFYIQEHFNLEEMRAILLNCGTFIKRIQLEGTLNGSDIQYHELVSLYCPNLEEITLIVIEVTSSNIYGRLLTISKNLHHLRCKKCRIDDETCLIISQLAKLQILDLEETNLIGNHLHRLKKLTNLNLKHYRCIKSRNLKKIFKSNKLKVLNISHCKELTAAVFRTIIETQTDLEHLIVNGQYQFDEYEEIGGLKNLKEFTIRDCMELPVANYLSGLLKYEKQTTLECLDIHFGCGYSLEPHEFVEREINARIVEFRNLKVLCLPYCWALDKLDLVPLVKACSKLEMLDIAGTIFMDNEIVACVEYLGRLRFLDISYCHVGRRLYSIMVEIRREKKCREQLIVFIKPKTAMASWLDTEYYENSKHVVKLSLGAMRLTEDGSMLSRLQQLKDIANIDTKNCKRVSLKKRTSLKHNTTLENLGDDCLYHMMSFLNLPEKVTLIQTGTRFDGIFRHFLQVDIFDLYLVLQHLTSREVRQVLQRFGSEIKRLSLKPAQNLYSLEYYELAAKYCTNLTELYWYLMQSVELDLLKQLVSSSKYIEILKLDNCPLDDDVLEKISKLEYLKVLNLEKTNASGNHLSKLSRLVDLNLSCCPDFEPKNIIDICKKNKFKSLNISGCEKFDNSVFDTLIETQTDLEHITIGTESKAIRSAIVTNFKKLISWNMKQCAFAHVAQNLETLATYGSENVQFLVIDFIAQYPEFNVLVPLEERLVKSMQMNLLNFTNLTGLRLPENTIVNDDYVNKITRICPRLEVLDLRRSHHLTDDGIVMAVNQLFNLKHFEITSCKIKNHYVMYGTILSVMKERQRHPLVLYAEDDKILRAFSRTKEYQITKKYVTISQSSMKKMNFLDYRKTRQQEENVSKDTSKYRFESKHQTSSTLPPALNLPDKCLINIMLHLDPIDQLKLILLHDRIDPPKDFLFDLTSISQNFTMAEAEEIFRKCAKNVKRICCKDSFSAKPLDYLKLIQPFVPQLTEIEINSCNREFSEYIYELLSTSQQLEVVKFENGYFSDNFVLSLRANRNLKILSFSRSHLIPRQLDQFVNLVELRLGKCHYVENEEFIKICRNCKLKVLDICHCIYLLDEAFETLVDTQTDLEDLSISLAYYANNFLIICQLPNLKHLTINYDTSEVSLEPLLDSLVAFRKDELLTLEIRNLIRLDIGFCLADVVEKWSKKFRKLDRVQIHQPEVQVYPYFHCK